MRGPESALIEFFPVAPPWTMTKFTLLRRLAVFVLAILILSLAGLGLLLFRWWGERGAPPAGRLYVSGDFEGHFKSGALVVLRKTEPGNACFEISAPAEEARVCRGKAARIWVGDALLHLSIGARGAPRVSVAGLKARAGDWIGSLADTSRPHPRVPVRAYGVPALAGRLARAPDGLAFEVHDRRGRLAVVRAAAEAAPEGRILRPGFGARLSLRKGDVLWLGLVAFEVEISDEELVLRRVDRLRPLGTDDAPAADLGGDRRWLGRLWHVETPDAAAAVPERFEIFPMRARYTPHHLSRQRTNFEGEDVVQRLIDGEWLCLEQGEVVWRSLDAPGCKTRRTSAGIPRSAMEDYQRARYGDLAFVAGSMVTATNAALAEERYLADATSLPLAFDWRLAYREKSRIDEGRPPWPVPHRLWGVRFGTTRQIRRVGEVRPDVLPDVLPRSSTARHVVQVLEDQTLLASFFLAGERGSLCLGRHEKGVGRPYRPASGLHLPLGSVAFDDDPREGTWSADPDAVCQGCRIRVAVEAPAGQEERLVLGGAECDLGGRLLRAVDRGRPWLAATDPGTGRRYFAEELYLAGGLRPLLGDPAALSGVEAALREYGQKERGSGGGPPTVPAAFELTVDGDLQLAAAAAVDALAKEYITAKNDPEGDRVSVTAAILDAESGDLLAVVNWSRRGAERARRHDWERPTAWELGSGQADVLENSALLRRGAVGSTMKITASYALLNSGALEPGPDLERSRHTFLEAGGDGRIFLERGGRGSARKCSTGPHYLPADARGFTHGTFVGRFAKSCNNFFVLSGFRHAGSVPAKLGRTSGTVAGRGEIWIRAANGRASLVQPPRSEETLAQKIRAGLAADFAPGSAGSGSAPSAIGSELAANAPPRSLFGVLHRLGFQPRPGAAPSRGEVPSRLRFQENGGAAVVVPLVNDWFSPSARASERTPALEAGRDFAYPGVPSPGRLDESTVRGAPALEHYDGTLRKVRRRGDDGRSDVQYSMLLIGQSSVEASALGLAALFAPAARSDGRAVSPCLFRANCGPERAGARVLDTAAAGPLNDALRAVVREGTARGGLYRSGLGDLPSRGWGGKTGTYQVEERVPSELSRVEWRGLRAWACGVAGVRRPAIRNRAGAVRRAAHQLAAAPSGAALGARTCEAPDLPLNPAGVHRYGDARAARALDELAAALERTATRHLRIFHSFVALVPPERGTGWPAAGNPAQGVVVAVLVDRETEREKSIAVRIGGELAAAVERWATFARERHRSDSPQARLPAGVI